VYGIRKKESLMVTSNLLKPTRLIEFQLRQGVVVIENPKFSPDVSRKYTIADMIKDWSSYGSSEEVRQIESHGGAPLSHGSKLPLVKMVNTLVAENMILKK
jgi:hypothetical protein